MNSLLLACLWAGCGASCSDLGVPEASFLYQPAYALDEELRLPVEPYHPQPGDIFLCSDRLWYWQIGFNLAFTGHPHHSGVVIARPDGRLAILESGPHDGFHVEINDVLPHLNGYDSDGPIWIRKRRTPLTAEQSARLTAFAIAQEGKRFAVLRLCAQVTLLRSRGPLRTWIMGGPHGNRDSFFCSELLLESLVASGSLDPNTTRPAATYPKDIFFDHSYNLYINRTLNLSAEWYPPARWTSQPIQGPVAADKGR